LCSFVRVRDKDALQARLTDWAAEASLVMFFFQCRQDTQFNQYFFLNQRNGKKGNYCGRKYDKEKELNVAVRRRWISFGGLGKPDSQILFFIRFQKDKKTFGN
jgi:hypothetical protein